MSATKSQRNTMHNLRNIPMCEEYLSTIQTPEHQWKRENSRTKLEVNKQAIYPWVKNKNYTCGFFKELLLCAAGRAWARQSVLKENRNIDFCVLPSYSVEGEEGQWRWLTSIIPHIRPRAGSQMWSQPGLHSNIRAELGNLIRSCLKIGERFFFSPLNISFLLN